MRTLNDVNVKNKCVLVRTDYNVPNIESDLRIRASLPTIRELEEKGARKIVLISHLGRPKGVDESLSLKPVAERLSELLGEEVKFNDPEAKGIVLLENLRFDPREKANNIGFAKEIVEKTGAEVFVQDGFAVTHRAHTSTSAIAEVLPAVAGRLVEKEVAALTKVMENPERPFIAIIGGAKVEDKEPLIAKFSEIADKVLIGGKIAVEMGLKMDFDEDSEENKLDIGPVAAGEMIKELMTAKTVLWNGVLGKVEDPAFATSSEIIAKYLGEHTEIFSVICGGDTTGFVEKLMETEPELSYGLISTGGGATLTLLTGGEMPGLRVLENC